MIKFQNQLLYQAGHILIRATSGIRRRPWLHIFSTLTLAAAFLSFTATLTAALNLDQLINRWVGNSEMTVYLKNGTTSQEMTQLKKAVEVTDGVASVTLVTPAKARSQFAADLGSYGDVGASLPVSAFPATLDIHLTAQMSADKAKRHQLAARLAKVNMIEEVENYDDWFNRLSGVATMGRTAAWGLGLLALVVAILVVAAAVRSGVTARRREIEVMRYVGATERYVRLPFILEGAMESCLAMGMALVALHYLMDRVEQVARDILPLLGGGSLSRLGTVWLLSLIAGGVLAGIIGARLSLRKLERA